MSPKAKKGKKKKKIETLAHACLDTLPNACQHQPLIVATRLTLDPRSQAASVPLFVRSANVSHMVAVPI